ncbi:MAG: hypothetical protein Q9168_001939 [Polycauliona sp. 1 TL-2023]
MPDVTIPDAPDDEQQIIDEVRAMSEKARGKMARSNAKQYIKHLANDPPTIEEDIAISSAHEMTPERFKERIDEMFWFFRMRGTLAELDGLLGVARDLRQHLKGHVTETYPTYLEFCMSDTVHRLMDAIDNLRSTARYAREVREIYMKKMKGEYTTNVGTTEAKAKVVHDVDIGEFVAPMPDAPKEWIDLDEKDFEFVWANFEALEEAMQGWKTISDRELETLKDELYNIWKIAATFDLAELVSYGFRGV